MFFLGRKSYFISMIVLLWVGPASAVPQGGVMQTFYNHIETKHEPSALIGFLETFIQQHPTFEPAYAKLAEIAWASHKIEHAALFFNEISQSPAHEPLSHYGLAILLRAKIPPDSVATLFRLACYYPHVPFAVINRYIKFDAEHSHKYDAMSQIISSNIAELAKKFAVAADHYHSGRFSKAASELVQLIPFTKDPLVYYLLAASEISLGQIENAEQSIKEGLFFCNQTGNLDLAAMFYNLLFNVYWDPRDTKSSRRALQKADSLANRAESCSLQCLIDLNKAFLSRIDGDYKTAATRYEEIANRFAQLNDDKRAARAYNLAAEAYYTLSHYSKALNLSLKGLDLYDQVGDNYERIDVLQTIAKIHSTLGLPHMAAKYLDEALLLARQNSYQNKVRQIVISKQKLRAEQSPHKLAAQIFIELNEKYSELRDINPMYNYWMAANHLEAIGLWQEAEFYYQKARSTAIQTNDTYMAGWAQFALLQMRQKRDKALSSQDFDDLIKMAHERGAQRLEASTYLLLGDYYLARQNWEKSSNCYKKSVAIYEDIHDSLKAAPFSMGAMASFENGYHRLAEFYARRYWVTRKTRDAANVIKYEELHHARSLKEEIRSRKWHKTGPTSDIIEEKAKRLQALQSALRSRRNDISDEEIDRLASKCIAAKLEYYATLIKEAHRDSTAFHTPYTPQPLAELQNSLFDETILLYHSSERLSYVLAMKKDSVDIIPLSIDRKQIFSQIDTLVGPLHETMASSISQTPFFAMTAHRLFKKLFEPVRARFPLTKKVYVLLPPEFSMLPLGMLLKTAPEKSIYFPTDEPDYAQHFLVQDYAFFYGPNTIELIGHDRSKPKPKLLIEADPFEEQTYQAGSSTLRSRTGWSFAELPYAQIEADLIRNLWPRTRCLTGHEATEKNFKAMCMDYDILHIATHAFMDTLFEDFSGLVLARDPESGEDGILQGYEINNLRLGSDLVTLSACETGRGRTLSGEGLLALPRHFLLAGAKSVIMSLWKVDDRFASLFMPKFYDTFLLLRKSKACSLRDTKIWFINQDEQFGGNHYAHPVFWAAFNLYGDPGLEQDDLTIPSPFRLVLLLACLALVAGSAFMLKRKKARV